MNRLARSFGRCLILVLPLAGALAAPARAQLVIPDTFTNLKVLPKHVSRDSLLATMRTFAGALGVRCDYCHAEKPEAPGATAARGEGAQASGGAAGAGAPERAAPPAAAPPGAPAPGAANAAGATPAGAPPGGAPAGARPFAPPRLDFASDKKDQKRIARSMLRMVMSINKSYLAKIAELDTPRVQVSCITCHHGVSQPRTLTDVLGEEVAQKGVAAAVRDYAQLKTRYYGSGAYDFREGPLDELAGRLTSQDKPDDALAILDLAEHEFPQSGTVPFLQAEALVKKGDKAGAIARYQHALELQPRNELARRRLQELQGSQ